MNWKQLGMGLALSATMGALAYLQMLGGPLGAAGTAAAVMFATFLKTGSANGGGK